MGQHVPGPAGAGDPRPGAAGGRAVAGARGAGRRRLPAIRARRSHRMTHSSTEPGTVTDDFGPVTDVVPDAADGGVPRPEVCAPEPWAFPEAARGRLGNGLEVVSYDI